MAWRRRASNHVVTGLALVGSLALPVAGAFATRAPHPTVASSPFTGLISSYARTRLGRATAAVLDTETGRTWSLQPGDLQATASIVKVDILATLLSQQRPAGTLPPTVTQATAAEMIEQSDNDAATDLWDAVGGHVAIESFDRRLGMEKTFPSTCLECPGFAWPGWGLTLTTAADQVALVRDFVFPNRWLSPVQRDWALGLLEHVVPAERWGISSGVPADVVVALKDGWVPLASGLWQIDSIGWVDGEGRNYIAAVLSTGNTTEQYGIGTVDTIGADLYARLGP